MNQCSNINCSRLTEYISKVSQKLFFSFGCLYGSICRGCRALEIQLSASFICGLIDDSTAASALWRWNEYENMFDGLMSRWYHHRSFVARSIKFQPLVMEEDHSNFGDDDSRHPGLCQSNQDWHGCRCA